MDFRWIPAVSREIFLAMDYELISANKERLCRQPRDKAGANKRWQQFTPLYDRHRIIIQLHDIIIVTVEMGDSKMSRKAIDMTFLFLLLFQFRWIPSKIHNVHRIPDLTCGISMIIEATQILDKKNLSNFPKKTAQQHIEDMKPLKFCAASSFIISMVCTTCCWRNFLSPTICMWIEAFKSRVQRTHNSTMFQPPRWNFINHLSYDECEQQSFARFVQLATANFASFSWMSRIFHSSIHLHIMWIVSNFTNIVSKYETLMSTE